MEIVGYLGALVMGITLGLFGGGGSILTVPIRRELNYQCLCNTALVDASIARPLVYYGRHFRWQRHRDTCSVRDPHVGRITFHDQETSCTEQLS